VSASGTLPDVTSIAICTAPNSQTHPAVGFDGTNYLVAWDDRRSNAVADLYAAGSLRRARCWSRTAFPSRRSQRPGDARADFRRRLVLRHLGRPAGFVAGARITPAVSVLDNPAWVISTTASGQLYPTVAFDGANYLVVWTEIRGTARPAVFGARVNGSGSMLDSQGFPIALNGVTPVVTFGAGNYFVAWTDRRVNEKGDLYGAR